MACLLVFLLALTWVPAARATEVTEPPAQTASVVSGVCGQDLTWSFGSGTLTIAGSGAMYDFPESTMAPWYHLREEIYRIQLPNDLTSVGSLAFYGCDEITAVTIPDSVTVIGEYAFAQCSGIQILDLGSGLTRISRSAFEGCGDIAALRLPNSLEYIGMKAFYRCGSITALVIPEKTTHIGISAFAYCEGLLTADIRAPMTEVPEYMFYGCQRLTTITLPPTLSDASDYGFWGCEQLSNVNYGGTELTPEELQEMISANVPEFEEEGTVSNEQPPDTVSSGTITENEDGSLSLESNTVTQDEDVTISADIESPSGQPDGATDLTVDIVISGQDGWEQAQDVVHDTINNYQDLFEADQENVEIKIYISEGIELDQSFLDSLTQWNVTIRIITADGSVWRIDTATLEGGFDACDLRCEVSVGDQTLCDELETSASFRLRFLTSAQINAEIVVRLGKNWNLQNATLLQKEDGELVRHQSTVVDNEGYAHFYLASVREDTEYYIAMNLPSQDDVIIPDELAADYGQPIRYNPIQYEITGRTSSWGMNIRQVTWIMIGVLTCCVVVVGFVMYTLNKRKLAMGYVPDLDEEDYE